VANTILVPPPGAKHSALQITNAINNADKHRKRNSCFEARIRTTKSGANGATVTIEVEWGTPTAYTVYANDHADRCMAEWRALFASHSITEP
jgi:hypothetical protein